MTYTVTLCDASFSDVRTTAIRLEATSSGGTVLSSFNNGPVHGGFGATLSFTPSRQRFNIEIDTTGTSYAPLVLEDLNGDRQPQTINVVLLSLPTHSGGRRPSAATDIEKYVQQQGWSNEEIGAVYTTVRALLYAKRQIGNRLQIMRKNAESALGDLGINPNLIVV